MPWTCENCGRTFDRAGQAHSCRASNPADAFGGRGARWLPLYEELKRRAEARLGPFEEYCHSRGIVMWKHSSTFGEVKLKRDAMEVEFYADRLRIERNPVKWMRTSANRVLHVVAAQGDGNLDDIVEWIVESYVLTRK